MKKYKVIVPEVHYSIRIVEADSLEDAIEAGLGDTEDEILEYSHTLYDDVTAEEVD